MTIILEVMEYIKMLQGKVEYSNIKKVSFFFPENYDYMRPLRSLLVQCQQENIKLLHILFSRDIQLEDFQNYI